MSTSKILKKQFFEKTSHAGTPLTSRMEAFQIGCIRVIVAPLGITIGISDTDYGCKDIQLTYEGYIDEEELYWAPSFYLQLKSSSSLEYTKDAQHVIYHMENRLAERMHLNKAQPIVLALLELPKDPNEWFVEHENGFSSVLPNRMYWATSKEFPRPERDFNPKSKKKLLIPTHQRITQASIFEMMKSVATRDFENLYNFKEPNDAK